MIVYFVFLCSIFDATRVPFHWENGGKFLKEFKSDVLAGDGIVDKEVVDVTIPFARPARYLCVYYFFSFFFLNVINLVFLFVDVVIPKHGFERNDSI